MICFLICYVMFSSFSFYLFYYHYYYFFFPFFLFFYYTSCTLFPTNKPLHPQCRRLIILEYEGELYRVEVEVENNINSALPDVSAGRNLWICTIHGSRCAPLGGTYASSEPAYVSTILYHSLILSHLHYCTLLWANSYHSHLHKLRLLQKKAI